jgi:hypothetical protein
MPPAPALAESAWAERLGDASAFPAYLAYYAQRSAALGIGAVLAAHLPRLMPGIPTGAFHGIIMSAYAIQRGDEAFLCEALAYFSSAYQELELPADRNRSDAGPAGILDVLEVFFTREGRRTQGGNIIEMMASLAGDSRIRSRIGFPDWAGHDFFPCLTREAVRIYLATRDFTALHLITSLHAMRVIASVFPITEGIKDTYWYSFCLAGLTVNRTASQITRHAQGIPWDWDAIKALAILSDDDHVVKLVHTCYEEHLHYREPAYLDAAMLALSTGA